MENICPLCNGLQSINEICPNCGEIMVDGGALANYLGPYSPYAEIASLPSQSEAQCIHLIYCPKCRYDDRVSVSLITI